MKKCPNCGAQIIDDSLFCTECGKPIPQGNVCLHCGASVNEGDVFCQCCGKRVDESPSLEMTDSMQKKCPYCGASINEEDAFCQNCGSPMDGVSTPQPTFQSTSSYDEVENTTDYKKIIIPIVIGLIVLTLIGGGWYGYKEYSAYSERKQAREKFIADSLKQARKDSIRLAELKEKERLDSIENARISSLQKPYLELLDKYGSKEDHWEELYFLYDLNGDNYPEMWLQVNENDEFHLLVYTNIEGEAKLLFRGNSGWNNSYYQGDNYILKNYAHMGSQVIYKYYLQNGKIKEENYFTLEAESFNEAVYKEISEPEVTVYEITDKSPIYEIE